MQANYIYYGLMIINLLCGEAILFNIKPDWLLHLPFLISAIFVFTFFKKSIDHPHNKPSECFFYGPIISYLIAFCGFFLFLLITSIRISPYTGLEFIIDVLKFIIPSIIGALLGSLFASGFIVCFIVLNTIGLFLYYKIMLKNSAK